MGRRSQSSGFTHQKHLSPEQDHLDASSLLCLLTCPASAPQPQSQEGGDAGLAGAEDSPPLDEHSEPLPARGPQVPLPSSLQFPDLFPPSSPKELPASCPPRHTHMSEHSLMRQKNCDSGVRQTESKSQVQSNCAASLSLSIL